MLTKGIESRLYQVPYRPIWSWKRTAIDMTACTTPTLPKSVLLLRG